MVWYSHLFQNFPQFIVIHTVEGFGVVNKAEVDIFLELSCFFDDPMDVGNLSLVLLLFVNLVWLSGSSWFMNCWSLAGNFEHCFACMWEVQLCGSLNMLWHCFFFFLRIEMKTDLIQSCGHCWDFQICLHGECSTLTASSRLPHSQSLPSGSFHEPLILIHQGADRMKTTITEN